MFLLKLPPVHFGAVSRTFTITTDPPSPDTPSDPVELPANTKECFFSLTVGAKVHVAYSETARNGKVIMEHQLDFEVKNGPMELGGNFRMKPLGYVAPVDSAPTGPTAQEIKAAADKAAADKAAADKAKQEAETKAAAELKAKQEAELKAKQAAELKAKQEAEKAAADKAAADKAAAELKAKQEAEKAAAQPSTPVQPTPVVPTKPKTSTIELL